MATISLFFGIAIRMYTREHGIAHFHAIYGDEQAAIAIESLAVLEGRLPRRVMALVAEWALEHRPELRANWERGQRHEAFVPIAPLE